MFLKKYFSFFKSFDWSLFLIVFILISISLAIQYTLCLGLEQNDFTSFNHQLIFAILGIALFFLLSFIDYRNFKAHSHLLYFILLIILVLILFIGITLRGTKGWLALGPFNFQAVELAKIILVISLAKFWSAKIKNGIYFKEIILSGLLVLPPFILVLLQPDFGSASILLATWFLI